MSNIKKHEKMNTKNNTSEKTIWIEWSNKKNVIAQFKTIESFMSTDWLMRQADNFGQTHLVKNEMDRWSKYPVHNIFVVEMDPVHNYGLDFQCWIHYTADGMNFMREISTGGSSITSAPLVRVMLNTKSPVGMDWNDLSNNTPEIMKEWMQMINDNVIESFAFSSNVAFKKDASVRHILREQCQKHNFIFA
jgi:hypothetical protein